MILAEVGLGELLWALIVLFFMVIYWMTFFSIILDLFRDDELTGASKALWFLFLLVLPLVSMFVYLIARGDGMASRSMARARVAQAEFDDYVRGVASSSPASELARAKELLDQGTITADEFEALKRKVLA